MDKKTLISKYFQRKNLLTVENTIYKNHVTDLFNWILKTDKVKHDTAANSLELNGTGRAEIIAKQDGIIAGIEEVVYLSKNLTKIHLDAKILDGTFVTTNEIIISLSGNNEELLAFERVFLNILGRMSGIATTSNRLISVMKQDSPAIAATRKTPWMLLDKKAVAVGGGLTHRVSLNDWPMIKDNHLVILQQKIKKSMDATITEVIKRMIHIETEFFEIEVESQEQAGIAIETFQTERLDKPNTFSMAILLDNFHPEIAKATIVKLKKNPVYENIIIEASGNVTEKNLSLWKATGVDILSLGALTHSSQNFDVSMRFI